MKMYAIRMQPKYIHQKGINYFATQLVINLYSSYYYHLSVSKYNKALRRISFETGACHLTKSHMALSTIIDDPLP